MKRFLHSVNILYKTIIFPVVLYGCETWSLALIEQRRLGVADNRMLRRIFGSRRDEVTGGWRKLHNEDFITCTIFQIVRMAKRSRMRWARHIVQMGKRGMLISYWWEKQ
jgi:hypothetical protein